MSYRCYASIFYTRMPDSHMILTTKKDTFVRLHPDKQLTNCSIEKNGMQELILQNSIFSCRVTIDVTPYLYTKTVESYRMLIAKPTI
jgi:hypothetical protein